MMTTASEFLEEPELVAMTGAKAAWKQIEWLEDRGWVYEVTASNRPIVGRIYTRMKLSGVAPSEQSVTAEPWAFDLSKVD